ncbi:DUF2809 domain-containing protein [Flavobacterium aquariorum]|uniref:DUF2809 domain-containing protein n=1 Tax=Flavobacterium aquariorum TaxID=2217670 RepID=A0A2W7U3V3_9FLAO|nr:DUF2809 domain-containing protein [Flavobacterium aquariorum]PZX91889.1 DUF2809 domain-containing protein [Flavobacterium aquariorum]
MLTFNKNYFGFAILIFLIEILIALYMNDPFVRPYLGDVLVVILMYCFLKSFLKIPVLTVAIVVLFFSFTVEFLQFLNIVEKLGLGKSKIARTVIGTSFSWIDLLTYLFGISIVIVTEKFWMKTQNKVMIFNHFKNLK